MTAFLGLLIAAGKQCCKLIVTIDISKSIQIRYKLE